jgi:hypothetical protein
MIITTDAYISGIVCHKFCIDNSCDKLSIHQTNIDNVDNISLKNILLDAFVPLNEVYEFVHDIDINLNVLKKIIGEYWDKEDLLGTSKNIYHHLKTVAIHPKIKSGDLVLAKFEDVQIENSYYEALGIYKIEQKESFLEIDLNNGDVASMRILSGILSRNIDKACLVVFTKEEPWVFVIDKNNKDTQYWIDDFLHVRQRKDEFANTQNVMAMAKNFVTKELPKEFEVSKADQIDLLNKSLQFFKEKDTFDLEEFAHEVIEQPEVIESFHNFKRNYESENDISIDDSFTISNYAFKKQQRSYKRVINLDKKIQIIINGNRDHVEQGEDEKGKFYKVYYNSEE